MQSTGASKEGDLRMAYLSRNDIEAIAARIFNDYRQLPRFAGQPVTRIDPVILATELCGLHIDHFHLSKNGMTLGLTSFSKRDKFQRVPGAVPDRGIL